MIGLLPPLLYGLPALVALFLFLRRFTPLAGTQLAVLLALLTLAVYLPIAVTRWPGADVVTIQLSLFGLTLFALALLGRRGQGQRRPLHWAPVTLIAFFGVIFVVNIVLITLANHGLRADIASALLPAPRGGQAASSFFPGVVAHDFQKKESLFNAYLEQRAEQAERGWRVGRGWLGEARAGKESVFQLGLRDASGSPLTGCIARVRFLRPSDQRLDQTVTLNEMGDGLYRQVVVLPSPGLWQVHAQIDCHGQPYELLAETDLAAAE